MDFLIEKVEDVRNSDIKKQIDKRIKEFNSLKKKDNKDWFSELCFCILTANTSAELGIRIQKELGYKGFTNYKTEADLAKRLKKAKYRFYNRRAHFIHLANKHKNIKDILKKIKNKNEKRQWLVENIKGMGYKEASHFLRNVGFLDYAILDKHVQRLMAEMKLITLPKTMNKKKYLEFEKVLDKLCDSLSLKQGELDLYLWYIKTGKVLK